MLLYLGIHIHQNSRLEDFLLFCSCYSHCLRTVSLALIPGQFKRVLEQRLIWNARFYAFLYIIVCKSFHLFQLIHFFWIVLRSLLFELPRYLNPHVFPTFCFFRNKISFGDYTNKFLYIILLHASICITSVSNGLQENGNKFIIIWPSRILRFVTFVHVTRCATFFFFVIYILIFYILSDSEPSTKLHIF